MFRKVLLLALATCGVGLGSWVIGATTRTGERPDCPGKIVCPQTGQLICRDQCPTVDPQRSDCPGRIVCPQTGQLVCKDRCPLETAAKAGSAEQQTPPCCAAK